MSFNYVKQAPAEESESPCSGLALPLTNDGIFLQSYPCSGPRFPYLYNWKRIPVLYYSASLWREYVGRYHKGQEGIRKSFARRMTWRCLRWLRWGLLIDLENVVVKRVGHLPSEPLKTICADSSCLPFSRSAPQGHGPETLGDAKLHLIAPCFPYILPSSYTVRVMIRNARSS